MPDSDSDDFMNSTVIDLTDVDERNKTRKSSCRLSFMNTNTRSLAPKVRSLYDCFAEMNVDFAVLTETWYQSNRQLPDPLAEYSAHFSLEAIVRNRNTVANNGRSYGGVAFAYRKARASFKNFPLVNPEDFEVLATVGKVTRIKGMFFVLSAYAPPNLPAPRAKALIEYISDVVGEAKRTLENCTIVMAGDFNQWPIEELIQEHPDLTEVQHGPTRGDRAIDRSLVNFGRAISESGSLPPLETETGESDHRIAWARATFSKTADKLIKYTYREFTDSGAEAFLQDLNTQSWERVYKAQETNSKTEIFQEIIDTLLEKKL